MTGSKRNWIIISIFIVIAIIGFVYFMFFRGGTGGTSQVSPTPTLFEEEEPTPTPERESNKENIKIRLLNGSGVVGEAGRVKALLEKADFVVESTDNADSYDHKETDIQAKAKIDPSVVEEITGILTNDYTVSSSELDESEEVDIIIVIGARKNPPTAAPKTTPKATPTGGAAAPTSSTTSAPTATKAPTPTVIP